MEPSDYIRDAWLYQLSKGNRGWYRSHVSYSKRGRSLPQEGSKAQRILLSRKNARSTVDIQSPTKNIRTVSNMHP